MLNREDVAKCAASSHNELLAENDQLRELIGTLVGVLGEAEPYVAGAYECAFPDEHENLAVLDRVRAVLSAARKALRASDTAAGKANCGCWYHAEDGTPCEHDIKLARETIHPNALEPDPDLVDLSGKMGARPSSWCAIAGLHAGRDMERGGCCECQHCSRDCECARKAMEEKP